MTINEMLFTSRKCETFTILPLCGLRAEWLLKGSSNYSFLPNLITIDLRFTSPAYYTLKLCAASRPPKAIAT